MTPAELLANLASAHGEKARATWSELRQQYRALLDYLAELVEQNDTAMLEGYLDLAVSDTDGDRAEWAGQLRRLVGAACIARTLRYDDRASADFPARL